MANTKKSKKAAAKKRIVKKDPVATIEKKVESALKGGPKSNKELKAQTRAEDKELTRTLQRLRRRGVIKVVKGRWAMTDVKVCPKCKGKGWIEE